MSLNAALDERCESKCELCRSAGELIEYVVFPKSGDKLEDQVAVCSICHDQIDNIDNIIPNHWRCLNESMWSEIPAVQVVAFRMLHNLDSEDWAQDLLNMMYLDEETMEWAESTDEESEKIVHIDSNGNLLEAGDTVVLIKDLDVKGANFIAKRGTAVRRISLVRNNPEHIEGRVDGQHIVILTKYVKKSS